MRNPKVCHHRSGKPHTGFTLVELLVVLAIIGLLAAITAGAAIQIIASQRSSATQSTMQSLTALLNKRWAAEVDKAKKDPNIPQSVVNLAGGNLDRARVIWIKLCLRREFPMNFSEALCPYQLPSALGTSPLTFNDFPPNPTYARTLRDAHYYVPAVGETVDTTFYFAASQIPPNFVGQFDPTTWPIESSACLLMSLKQARGNASFSQDDLSRISLDSLTAINALSNQPQDTGLKLMVDAWGAPLYFYRWQAPQPFFPPGSVGPDLNNRDVDNSSPAGPFNPSNPKTFARDPLDPMGTLLDPAWNNYTNYSNKLGVFWFELYCHSVHEWDPNTPPQSYTPRSYYMTPTIVSAGRNGRLGNVQPPFPGLAPSPLLPDPMDVQTDPNTGLPTGDANDNIYSYRLRQGARGD